MDDNQLIINENNDEEDDEIIFNNNDEDNQSIINVDDDIIFNDDDDDDDNQEEEESSEIIAQSDDDDDIKNIDEILINEYKNINEDTNTNIKKKTFPYLTMYEQVLLIAFRTTQIMNGAPICIKTTCTNPKNIAIQELKEKKIPFKIKRKLPDGTNEIWKIKDLQLIHFD